MPTQRSRPTVVLGLLGTQLDLGQGPRRWERWRPTVSICQQDDLLVHRLELLTDPRMRNLGESVLADVEQVSPETRTRLHEVQMPAPWDFERVYESLFDFARGYDFKPDEEDYLVHITTGTHVAQICLFLLTESRHFPARLLQTSPTRGQGGSPAGQTHTIDLDLSRYDLLARRFEVEHEQGATLLKSGIETRNARFNRQVDQLERIALQSREPILLMGPTGAGKSQLAQRMYELRRHRHQLEGEFVEVNCATLRGDAAMSALFGHKKGAFTGAVADRPGLLKTADRGVLFLDEIGELKLDAQARPLRALEEKRFLPVGADREVDSDFQLVAGTNRDLREEVAQGMFRADLLARINLWTFELPGLADRLEDLPPNLDYELERFSRDHGPRVTFNRPARKRYLQFATSAEALWTGNFRDLNASVTRMATLAPGGRIDEDAVSEEIERLRRDWRPASRGRGHDRVHAALGDAEELDLFDRAQLETVLEVCVRSASLSAAGRELFAVSRRVRTSVNDADRLRKYLARFGLNWRDLPR